MRRDIEPFLPFRATIHKASCGQKGASVAGGQAFCGRAVRSHLANEVTRA
jgi:hypothetical protein